MNPTAPRQPPPRPQPREPDIDPAEAINTAVEIVRTRLKMAQSIAQEVFGEAASEETAISVYDRLNDQLAEMFGGDEEAEGE